MNKIEYEIKYNDQNRPFIELKNDVVSTEDRFFAFEVVKNVLYDIVVNDKSNLSNELLNDINIAGEMVTGLSIKIGEMIKNQNNIIDDVNDMLNNDKKD